MRNIAKKLLFGYVFVILLGSGCFGFMFMNFLNSTVAVLTATCATSLLLLGAFLVIAFIRSREKLVRETQSGKRFFTLFIALSLITVILAVLFFVFHGSIVIFFTEDFKLLRSTISILFVVSMVILVLLWFKFRK